MATKLLFRKDFTIDELNEINDRLNVSLKKQYVQYKSHWENKCWLDLFLDAYEIAKWTGIYDYLCNRIYNVNDIGTIRLANLVLKLDKEHKLDELVGILYGEEMDYDHNMWCNYDDMDDLIAEYCSNYFVYE